MKKTRITIETMVGKNLPYYKSNKVGFKKPEI